MENILNVFEIHNLSHYEKDEPVNDTSNCCICYDELDITKEKQIKLCDICNSLYHMTCICEVNFYLDYFYSVCLQNCILHIWNVCYKIIFLALT